MEGVFYAERSSEVHKHWTDDKELIVRFAAEDDILGHRGLSTHSTTYPITAYSIGCYDTFLTLDFSGNPYRKYQLHV